MLPLRPCLPTFAPFPPSGPDWLHEIKHDGYRMFAIHDGERVRLLSRYGVDWTCGFPMIVAAVEALAVRNCLIDGEVITCDDEGLADLQLLRRRQHPDPAILCAFDLLSVDGRDLRDEPIEERKAELARLLVDCRPALAFNRVFDDPGLVIFEHACKLGCKGIVSKRRGSRYAGGRSSNWLTVKNPGALAVRDGQEGRRALEQMSPLILRRASESHPDDYSVFHEGQRVGRIYRMQSTDRELWYWTEIGARAPNDGLADTLEAAETDFPQRLEDARVSQGENPAAPAGRKTGGALAEYYPLIVGAADDLESSTPESRRAFYDRIRSVLAAQLGKFDPPISESDLSVERQAREKAIQMVEALASAKEHAVSDAKIVADYASFTEKTRIRIDCFYGTNLLPHPKQAIIAAIWRQIVQESSDARVEWLRAARTFLWNFVEGADATPVPPMVVDLDRLRRDSAPELVVQQIVTQFCAIEDECNEPFRVIAKREDKQIKALITAAIDIRNELLIAMRSVNDASGDLLTRSGYATDQARGVEAMAGPGEETIEPSKELIREIEELLARAALKQRTLTRRPGSGSPARAARQPRWDDYRGY